MAQQETCAHNFRTKETILNSKEQTFLVLYIDRLPSSKDLMCCDDVVKTSGNTFQMSYRPAAKRVFTKATLPRKRRETINESQVDGSWTFFGKEWPGNSRSEHPLKKMEAQLMWSGRVADSGRDSMVPH